jgi:D-serine deaminase-like pyridoxal phosphate-dependent protein
MSGAPLASLKSVSRRVIETPAAVVDGARTQRNIARM